ncbi:MAG: hypothetical protein ACR2O0_06445 [Rhizobiaceae bacterium]
MRKLTYLAGCIVLIGAVGANGASADDTSQYDMKIEKTAAERVAAKLGKLRGTIPPNAKNVIHNENASLDSPYMGKQASALGLRSMVSYDVPGADPVQTGSLPPR